MPIYEPIPAGPWIRLLTLQPVRQDKTPDIVCTLHVALLDTAIYEAVSYVWGDPTKTRQIWYNGTLINVTVSLHGALRNLQSSEPRVLWADAICIDQSNLAERSSQVSIMGAIYERAKSVQIWLGDDTNGDAQPAFELCHEVVTYYEDGYHSDDESAWYDWPPQPPANDPMFNPERWKRLQALSRLPWFTRLWIIQEAGNAQTADVHWGSATIKLSVLIEAFIYVTLHSCFLPLVNEYGFDFTYITDTWWQIWCTWGNEKSWLDERPYIRFTTINPEISQRTDIFNVLYIGTKFKASDPRDYIYGHLGHPAAWDEASGKPFMDVDYTKTVGNLNLDVAKILLDKKYGLLLLSAVEHVGEELIEEPSWVPQWHKTTDIGIIAPIPGFTRWYDACLTKSTQNETLIQVDHLDGQNRLHTRGVVFDTVSNISTAFEMTEDASSSQPVEAVISLIQPECKMKDLDALSVIMTGGMARHTGKAAEDNMEEHRLSFLSYCMAEGNIIDDIKERIMHVYGSSPEDKTIGDEYKRNLHGYCHHRRLFKTQNGRFGLGPSSMELGDVCCVLYGGCVPFVLRRRGSVYRFVGECYIHGVMRGEVVRDMLGNGLRVEEVIMI